MAAAKRFYAEPGHAVGGALHCVLDDGNLQDGHIAGSRERAVAGQCHCNRRPCLAAVDLCDQLIQMTVTQRTKVQRGFWR